MKLTEWSRKNGIAYRTAWRWFKTGQLPVPAIQLETGTILVQEVEPFKGRTVLYGRVSSHDQKKDLEKQIHRLRTFASAQGLVVDDVLSEVASGLNDKRKGLLKILADKSVTTIVVEHRDRLGRFGTTAIETLLNSTGRTLLVADETEQQNDLVQDFVDLATSFCAKIYGKRSAKNRAKRMIEASREDS